MSYGSEKSTGSISNSSGSGSDGSENNPFGIVTITYSWPSGQQDLDSKTTFLSESVGYGYGFFSNYMVLDTDNINAGPEIVTINLAQAWIDGLITDSATIELGCDWYSPSGGSGPANIAWDGWLNHEGQTPNVDVAPGQQLYGAATVHGTLIVHSDSTWNYIP